MIYDTFNLEYVTQERAVHMKAVLLCALAALQRDNAANRKINHAFMLNTHAQRVS